jgi:hypothetical protein
MTGASLPAGAGIFPFATMSRLVLEPTQVPIKWLLAASLGVKKVEQHDSDSSLPSSAKVKKAYRALPHVCLYGRVPKLRDSFSFITSQCNSVFGSVRASYRIQFVFMCL